MNKGKIEVFLKLPDRQTCVAIWIYKNEQVDTLKCRILELTGLPVCKQRIVCAGKEVYEECGDFKNYPENYPITVADFGVSHMSTLFVIVRLAGC